MTRSALRPGSIIGGKYVLERLLGQGGMGSVFAARNTVTGKRVAIKCLHEELARNPEAGARFKREAKASARIRHPNVVDVYDILSEDGAFFLVMELLEGEPLSSLLERTPTPLPDLIRIVLAAMRGVAAAHREGVIHRDIKPENIFLAREGSPAEIVPKLLDFGISKLQGTQDLALTRPEAPLGTVLYMSIEQLRGDADVDARTDVYAFGVILYQALTGRAPFDAETLPALLLRVMTEQLTPVKQLRPDAPAQLARLIEWSMQRNRNHRIPSLDVFIAELAPFASEASYIHHLRTRLLAREHRANALAVPNDTPQPARTSTPESAPAQMWRPSNAHEPSLSPPRSQSPGWKGLALLLVLLGAGAPALWLWSRSRVTSSESVARTPRSIPPPLTMPSLGAGTAAPTVLPPLADNAQDSRPILGPHTLPAPEPQRTTPTQFKPRDNARLMVGLPVVTDKAPEREPLPSPRPARHRDSQRILGF